MDVQWTSVIVSSVTGASTRDLVTYLRAWLACRREPRLRPSSGEGARPARALLPRPGLRAHERKPATCQSRPGRGRSTTGQIRSLHRAAPGSGKPGGPQMTITPANEGANLCEASAHRRVTPWLGHSSVAGSRCQIGCQRWSTYTAMSTTRSHRRCTCHVQDGVLYWPQDSRRASALRFHVVSCVPQPETVQFLTPVVTGSK
jgi:hypothetical protein